MAAAPDGIYRTPGRTAPAPRVPPPSLRRLLSPLGHASLAVAALLLPLVLLNAIFDPDAAHARDTRLVPAVETLEDVFAVLMLGTLVLVVALVARRVAPSWSGLGRWTKVAYVSSLVVLQAAVVLGGEAALFMSRGGLHLFEPTHKTSSTAPDGRSAHVFGGGLGCGFEVYTAEPHALTMKRTYTRRAACDAPAPHVRWNADGSVSLVDDAGAEIPEGNGTGFHWFGGGC